MYHVYSNAVSRFCQLCQGIIYIGSYEKYQAQRWHNGQGFQHAALVP